MNRMQNPWNVLRYGKYRATLSYWVQVNAIKSNSWGSQFARPIRRLNEKNMFLLYATMVILRTFSWLLRGTDESITCLTLPGLLWYRCVCVRACVRACVSSGNWVITGWYNGLSLSSTHSSLYAPFSQTPYRPLNKTAWKLLIILLIPVTPIS